MMLRPNLRRRVRCARLLNGVGADRSRQASATRVQTRRRRVAFCAPCATGHGCHIPIADSAPALSHNGHWTIRRERTFAGEGGQLTRTVSSSTGKRREHALADYATVLLLLRIRAD